VKGFPTLDSMADEQGFQGLLAWIWLRTWKSEGRVFSISSADADWNVTSKCKGFWSHRLSRLKGESLYKKAKKNRPKMASSLLNRLIKKYRRLELRSDDDKAKAMLQSTQAKIY